MTWRRPYIVWTADSQFRTRAPTEHWASARPNRTFARARQVLTTAERWPRPRAPGLHNFRAASKHKRRKSMIHRRPALHVTIFLSTITNLNNSVFIYLQYESRSRRRVVGRMDTEGGRVLYCTVGTRLLVPLTMLTHNDTLPHKTNYY